MADEAIDAAADVEADFWELGGFAAAGFAAEDDDLVGGDGVGDYLSFLDDGEGIGVGGLGEIGEALGAFLGGAGDFIGDDCEHFARGLVAMEAGFGGAQAGGEAMAVGPKAGGQSGDEGLRFEEHGQGTLRAS